MTVTALGLLPIDTIKKHLRVDHAGEDDLIELYAESALAWALWFCDNPKLVESGDFPASFKAALLLLIGHSYANREAIVTGTIATELPLAVDSLLWSSRDWRGPPDEVMP
ncbi:head-tail connector protein [Pseudomonas sp. UM16]|uniref:head-tail connector protein n=1 Tax=Pseudomonas sp. UM16 TaxID=3158962 RepID=UPI000FA5DE8D